MKNMYTLHAAISLIPPSFFLKAVNICSSIKTE